MNISVNALTNFTPKDVIYINLHGCFSEIKEVVRNVLREAKRLKCKSVSNQLRHISKQSQRCTIAIGGHCSDAR